MSDLPRALVVEDDELVRQVLRRLVERAGYDAVVAADGHDGARKLAAGGFQLLLTDMRMPGPDGSELTRIAIALPQPPRVIVCSGFTTLEEESEIEALGATFLRKPFDMSAAMQAILGET